MLPFILLVCVLSQGHAVDYGTEFVTAFPENLAFYFPATLSLNLKITTLLPATTVTVTVNGVQINAISTFATPSVNMVPVTTSTYEVIEIGTCNKTIHIVSDKNITVVAISKRGDSIQANPVPPTSRLGLNYLIPTFNYTEYAFLVNSYSVPQFPSTNTDVMDFSYRLVIINAANSQNQVEVMEKTGSAETPTTVTLGPFETAQLRRSNHWYKVKADAPVAVILTNPCVDSVGCKCNMISHQIRPNEFMGTEFVYPAINDTTRLFVTSPSTVTLTCDSQTETVEPGSKLLLPFLPFSATSNALLTTSAPAALRLVLPGLIVDLLPTSMFAGCFLVHKHLGSTAYALVIVEAGKEADVHVDAAAATATWTPITGTAYKFGNITISGRSQSVWHSSVKIGVYVFESTPAGAFTGGPAITLNDEPDPMGCIVDPLDFQLSNTTMTWQASRAYCGGKNMLLASPTVNYTHTKMTAYLTKQNANGMAWLGLRRSLLNSEWYWHKTDTFSFANWEKDQPGSGLCASMRMEPNGNYTWRTVRCCSPLLPLCVKDMVVISSLSDPTPVI